jgi:hypothetical protein
MTAFAFHRYRPAAVRGRVLVWLAALIFLLQMLAATEHHHELSAKSQHCVACTLHAQPHAAPPAPVLPLAPFAWQLLATLATLDVGSAHVPASAHLRPPPQGPPAFLSP